MQVGGVAELRDSWVSLTLKLLHSANNGRGAFRGLLPDGTLRTSTNKRTHTVQNCVGKGLCGQLYFQPPVMPLDVSSQGLHKFIDATSALD